MLQEYLKLFGLSPGAEPADVKKAYRKLARENHPDRFKDAEQKKKQTEKMALINEAYQKILSLINKPSQKSPAGKTDASVRENDYTLYKKGLAFFDQYTGSISLKFKNNTYDPGSLLEKKRYLESAGECFERVLKEFPESDWAYDSEERLKKIEKHLVHLERNIATGSTHTLGWTQKGTPYWKKNRPD